MAGAGRSITLNRMPDFGRIASTFGTLKVLWHGVPTATMAGSLLADAIDGDTAGLTFDGVVPPSAFRVAPCCDGRAWWRVCCFIACETSSAAKPVVIYPASRAGSVEIGEMTTTCTAMKQSSLTDIRRSAHYSVTTRSTLRIGVNL